MDIALFHSLWTVLVLILFVGIVVWAYGGSRREGFEEAARIPLADDEAGIAAETDRRPDAENAHG